LRSRQRSADCPESCEDLWQSHKYTALGNAQFFNVTAGNENVDFRRPLRDASNMQSQFTTLEQILLGHLECPVCKQYG